MTARQCPDCGSPLDEGTLDGLCPTCTTRLCLFSVASKSADPSSATMPLSFGDYDIIEQLARGGMGVVFKARQRSLNRTVALKLISAGQFASVEEQRRFRIEAEAAATLDHPNIVPIYEVGAFEGRAFFSMKLLSGGSLDKHLSGEQGRARQSARAAARESKAACRGLTRPTNNLRSNTITQAATLIGKVGRAVHHAHERGILHRDLKPANILLDDAGEPHVTDFGLAKLINGDVTAGATLSGSVLGTPDYMAPEQALGKANAVTIAGDIFSVGAVFYHLLTGRAPFTGNTPVETMRNVVEREPQRPREINPTVDLDLETICLKCLEKEPPRRYTSALALAEDLERWLRGEPIVARPITQRERVIKWAQRRPAVAALSGIAVLLLIAGVSGVLWQWRRADREAGNAKAALQRANVALVRADLERARSLLQTPQFGRRGKALASIAEAARIQPSEELRGEAITALGLIDLEPTSQFLRRPAAAEEVQQTPRAVSFNSDLSLVAWPLTNGNVSITRFPGGEEVVRLPSRGTRARATLWSPDDRFLAVRYDDARVVWNLETRRPVASTERRMHRLAPPVTFSSDSKSFGWVADGEIALYSLLSGDVRQRLSPLPTVHGFALHPSRPWLAAFTNREVIVFDLNLAQRVRAIEVDSGALGVGWSPDERVLMVMKGDSSLWAFDVIATNRNMFEAGADALVSFHFNPSGRLFTSVSEQGKTRLWDTLHPVELGNTQEGHALRFSGDGTRVGFARPNGVGVWSLSEPSPVYRRLFPEMDGEIGIDAAFTGDGTTLGLLDRNRNGVFFWNLEARALDRELPEQGGLRRLLFLPDGALLTLGMNGLTLWKHSRSGTNIAQFWTASPLVDGRPPGAPNHPLVFSHVTREVAFGAGPHEIMLLNVEHPDQRRTLHVGADVQSLSFSPDGQQLAVGTIEHGTRIYSMTDFGVVQQVSSARAVARFSPDGRWLANYTATECELWDTRTWTIARTFARALTDADPGRATFSPDGKLLLVLKSSKLLELVETRSLETLAVFQLPPGPGAYDATFNVNGESLCLFGTSAVHLYHLPSLRAELGKMNLDW